MHETLLLTRSDVADLLSPEACAAAVEEALRAEAEGRALPAAVLAVVAGEGTVHVKAAGLELARPVIAVKANANFPGNPARRGLPTIQGVVVLFDAATGAPLMLADSAEITALRTAAATAVAARALARTDAAVATVCGCGVQGRAHLRALRAVRPLRKIHAYDVDPARSAAFAREEADDALEVVAAPYLAAALRESAIVVTATTAREPFLRPEDIAPGTFVAAVGADSPDKRELFPELLARHTLVVDVLEQCAAFGELRHALAAGLLRREDVHATLGEVLAGRKPGRTSDDEVIVFDSTGTALEDVAAAAVVYERALAAGRGTRLALAS